MRPLPSHKRTSCSAWTSCPTGFPGGRVVKRERTLAVSMLLSYAVIAGASLEKNDSLPSSDQWLGLVVAFFLLSAASDLGAEWAGGLGLLLFVSILLQKGPDALAFTRSRREASKQGAPLTPAQKAQLEKAAAASPRSVLRLPWLSRPGRPTP